jgi:hypothetical protein
MDRMKESQQIFSRSMLVEKEEDILEALKAYRCTKIEKMESLKRTPNGILILTFATREIPDNVLCGYEGYGVKRYYPNSLGWTM